MSSRIWKKPHCIQLHLQLFVKCTFKMVQSHFLRSECLPWKKIKSGDQSWTKNNTKWSHIHDGRIHAGSIPWILHRTSSVFHNQISVLFFLIVSSLPVSSFGGVFCFCFYANTLNKCWSSSAIWFMWNILRFFGQHGKKKFGRLIEILSPVIQICNRLLDISFAAFFSLSFFSFLNHSLLFLYHLMNLNEPEQKKMRSAETNFHRMIHSNSGNKNHFKPIKHLCISYFIQIVCVKCDMTWAFVCLSIQFFFSLSTTYIGRSTQVNLICGVCMNSQPLALARSFSLVFCSAWCVAPRSWTCQLFII